MHMQGWNSDNGLYDRMYNSFGYLRAVGFQGHKFAVLMGEMGSKFDASSCCDLRSMNDQAKWLRADPGTGQSHPPIQAGLPICHGTA